MFRKIIFIILIFLLPHEFVFSSDLAGKKDYVCDALDISSVEEKDKEIKKLIESRQFKFVKKEVGDNIRFSFILDSVIKKNVEDMCSIEIPVYIDEGDHLHLWNIFAITSGNKIYIQDLNGDFEEVKAN